MIQKSILFLVYKITSTKSWAKVNNHSATQHGGPVLTELVIPDTDDYVFFCFFISSGSIRHGLTKTSHQLLSPGRLGVPDSPNIMFFVMRQCL